MIAEGDLVHCDGGVWEVLSWKIEGFTGTSHPDFKRLLYSIKWVGGPRLNNIVFMTVGESKVKALTDMEFLALAAS